MKRRVALATSAVLAVTGVFFVTLGNSVWLNAEGMELAWWPVSWLIAVGIFYGALKFLIEHLDETWHN